MDIDDYNDLLKDGLNKAFSVASAARMKNLDPKSDVEVKIAKDVAARVEGVVGPPGVAEVIRKMEQSGKSREEIAFDITKEIASGKIFQGTLEQRIEQAVRTSVGILTEGVLVAPTEGIAKVKVKKNPDGSDFVAVYYAGPIRSAGGTAAALSVVIADIARRVAGVGDYRATDSQVERYVEEIILYEARVAHLQYKPPEEDTRIIVMGCPVCVDGEPTEEMEVSVHRGIAGVETDRIRGGIPLVICEGIAQKAAKLFKYTKKLGLGWDWLEKIIKIKRKTDTSEIKPDDAFLEGFVAGRPVFAYPSTKGGFRLRYGRSRTNGLMAKNIHPATMRVLDNFLAHGTHMKIERPGKGCVVSTCGQLEAPVVKLSDGSVVRVESIESAEKLSSQISEILFLGDMLVAFGDFAKSNHPLIPPGYCEEWWLQEVAAKGIVVPKDIYESAAASFEFSKKWGVPLNPKFTFMWDCISTADISILAQSFKSAKISWDEDTPKQLTLFNGDVKQILESLLVEHRVVGETLSIGGEDGIALLLSLGLFDLRDKSVVNPLAVSPVIPSGNPLDINSTNEVTNKVTNEVISLLSGITIRPKAGTWIGARMGRPEKAKERFMDGHPNILFPTGSDKNRSLPKLCKMLSTREGSQSTNLELARYKCGNCGTTSPWPSCYNCNSACSIERVCQKCGAITASDTHCEVKTVSFDKRPFDIISAMDFAKKKIGNFMPEDLKGVKGLSNPTRVPEMLEKGLLRAKYDLYIFRDGTIRFDATDVPLTHFIPEEIGLSLGKVKELGYIKDYKGEPLISESQLVPLMQQDVLVSEDGAGYFFRVTKFIDEMLVNLYGLPSFYNLSKPSDIIGTFAVGLSPHTSAGVLCRIIGITKANVGYAHPYFHTAKRRNADGDEDSLMLLMDALINFSRAYLAETRGGTMDTPLVLTTFLEPKEVDDEVHNMELVWFYPLEFYEAATKYASPGDVKIKTVKDVLESPEKFEGFPITHYCESIHDGNLRTAYVTLKSIPEKLDLQFNLQKKIRAVNVRDAAERLILSHFIPDLYGNLRSYSRQSFRCSNCNTIYRRVPLVGKCTKCGGNIILTINKGGIEKYLKVTKKIIDEFDLPVYLKQRLELVEKEIKSIFEDEKVKQLGLSDFV